MESQQAVDSHGQGYQRDPNTVGLHSVVEGEDHGQHHEKKSVLMKVKAKAKKLKDTITKHGHGHDHHEGDIPDDHDFDEEDDEDEDEEMVGDPEAHGAPIYDSTAQKSAVPGLVLERPTGMDKGRNLPSETSMRHAAGAFKESQNRPMTEHGGVMPIDEGIRTPANTPQSAAPVQRTAIRVADPGRTFVHERPDQSKINLTRPEGLEEDPAAPGDREELYKPPNYEAKVTDPSGSGGDEAKITPIDQALSAMHIRDKPEMKPSQVSIPSMGSHDQFSREPIIKETETLSVPREPVQESHTTAGTEGGQRDEKPSSPGSYTEKISFATTVVADKAIAAKNILTSKLGYGTGPEGDVKNKSSGDQSPRHGGYAEKITSATHAIADKAVSAKNLVASKIGYGQKEDQTAHESLGVSEHPVDKTSERSSYTGKITAAAETAKDVVASKLGCGREEDAASHLRKEHTIGEGSAGVGTSVGEHGKKASGQDRGVSVKDYLAEKLKPGEEDRALSQVISSALDKRKKEVDKAVVITESEEVRRHLGEGNHGEGELSSPGKSMVDKLKGAVGSWLGKNGDPNTQQSHGSEAVPSGADIVQEEHVRERRLQESMS